MCAVVGDGEAETGPLATSWHSNKFLNPATDGAVLPILHLNGYKIANPTVLARIPREELTALMEGYGHTPYYVEGDDPADVHQQLAADARHGHSTTSARSSGRAREDGVTERPRWPMIVLRTPKGWTGPEGDRRPPGRGHAGAATRCRWARSGRTRTTARSSSAGCARYRPEELFDDDGRLRRRARGAAADRHAPDEREPRRERRRAPARPRSCRTSGTTPWTCPRPARRPPRRRACSGRTSAT